MTVTITKAQAQHRKKALSVRQPGRVILKLAGGFREAHLLSELISWWPYTTIMRGDSFWLVRSYADLKKATGMSEDAIKRALRVLEDREVIIRERHKFKGNKVHVWISFPWLVHAALWGEYKLPGWSPKVVSGGADMPEPVGANVPLHSGSAGADLP